MKLRRIAIIFSWDIILEYVYLISLKDERNINPTKDEESSTQDLLYALLAEACCIADSFYAFLKQPRPAYSNSFRIK